MKRSKRLAVSNWQLTRSAIQLDSPDKTSIPERQLLASRAFAIIAATSLTSNGLLKHANTQGSQRSNNILRRCCLGKNNCLYSWPNIFYFVNQCKVFLNGTLWISQ